MKYKAHIVIFENPNKIRYSSIFFIDDSLVDGELGYIYEKNDFFRFNNLYSPFQEFYSLTHQVSNSDDSAFRNLNPSHTIISDNPDEFCEKIKEVLKDVDYL
jgi:hypothetical protein